MDDEGAMLRAVELAEGVRGRTSPNPWVGAVVYDGQETFEGATAPPGGPHAEVDALARAGHRARGATMYVTLEPCAHVGRTGACVDAIVEAGVARVVVGIEDPDRRVSGRGLQELARRGVEVEVGVGKQAVAAQLAPYVKHRRTGRPWVTLKLAASLDGRIAAPDGSSRWITGEEARRDAHDLRSKMDAILVGAGTVRTDDPRLTVRHATSTARSNQPLRVVLGNAPPDAAAQPLVEMGGELEDVLDELGSRGVVNLLVEGGARVAHDFHAARLVDRYVLYLASVVFGGDDALPMFQGAGAKSIEDIWRGRIVAVSVRGGDLKVELEADSRADVARVRR